MASGKVITQPGKNVMEMSGIQNPNFLQNPQNVQDTNNEIMRKNAKYISRSALYLAYVSAIGLTSILLSVKLLACNNGNGNVCTVFNYLISTGIVYIVISVLSLIILILDIRKNITSLKVRSFLVFFRILTDLFWIIFGGISVFKDDLACIKEKNEMTFFAIAIWCLTFADFAYLSIARIYKCCKTNSDNCCLNLAGTDSDYNYDTPTGPMTCIICIDCNGCSNCNGCDNCNGCGDCNGCDGCRDCNCDGCGDCNYDCDCDCGDCDTN
jgi:hypothetical protein